MTENAPKPANKSALANNQMASTTMDVTADPKIQEAIRSVQAQVAICC
jgi:hypothetical protein